MTLVGRQSRKPFRMETLTTRQAADRVGVNVPAFFRFAAQHDVNPVLAAPGLRGAKFWNPRDVDRLVMIREAAAAAAS